MCSNYFDKLIIQARQLDNGIEKLSNIWKLPHLLIGGFAECTEETNSHVEAIWNIVNNTKCGIKEILSEIEESGYSGDSGDIEQFLQKTKNEYESIKQQCDSLESVLTEYGYHYSQDNSLDKVSVNSSRSTNQHSVGDIETLEVEFTPNLSWKHKKRQNELMSTSNDSCISHTFTTPISENSSIPYNHVCTPMRERPQEPIYSRHFYDLLKK